MMTITDSVCRLLFTVFKPYIEETENENKNTNNNKVNISFSSNCCTNSEMEALMKRVTQIQNENMIRR